MRIFINDIPVRIISQDKPLDHDYFHVEIDAANEKLNRNKLIHHVLINNMTKNQVNELLDSLNKHVWHNLYSITVTSPEFSQIRLYLNSKYKVVKAAGGLVRKNGKILMIYRLKKWDLPKGKMNKNEGAKEGALREVEEECGVKVKMAGKICSTRHTYTMNNKNILKKTNWYVMDCIDDKKMQPQIEEDIEEVKWMSPKEVYHALKDSYHSIGHVFRKYNELGDKKKAQSA
jgi:ADP-ribose pyrophosphatase YjhB (NUDIX family)